jgi:transposase
VLEGTKDREMLIDRVAALDIGKTEVMCCVRVSAEGQPGGGCGRRGRIRR